MSAADTLNEKLAKLASHSRRVGRGTQNGLLIYGRSGTSKTYTVLDTLEKMEVQFTHIKGHMNHEPLFDLLVANPDGVLVLDDISHIMGKTEIVEMLKAALGTEHQKSKRTVSFPSSKRKGKKTKVDYEGGIIFISNYKTGSHEKHKPLLSRCYPVEHDLTDDEMKVLFSLIAKGGYKLEAKGVEYSLSPKQCKETARFVWEKCLELDIEPNCRHLVEIGYKCHIDPDDWDWEELVEDGLREAKKLDSQQAEEEAKHSSGIEILVQCIQEATSKADCRKKWEVATGKKRPTFFRHLKKLSSATMELYEKLDEPEAAELQTKRVSDQQIFRDSVEDTIDILEDQGVTITQSAFISGEESVDDIFLDNLREHPDLWEWFHNLPPVSLQERLEEMKRKQ